MLKLIGKQSGWVDYERECIGCGTTILIHLFPGVSKEWAEFNNTVCIDCKRQAR